jgi:hypothetical protein
MAKDYDDIVGVVDLKSIFARNDDENINLSRDHDRPHS